MIKLINNQNRKVLGEGKRSGIGFAFVKNTEKDVFETVMPISPCKDYLNDVVFSEMTGKPCSAYGFKYAKTDCFKKSRAYLVAKICHHLDGNKYKQYDFELEALKNYHNLTKFLNIFEEKLGLKTLTQTTMLEDDTLLFSVPIYWCKSTWLISMYSLLIRVGRWYKEDEDPIDYLVAFKVMMDDKYLLDTAFKNIKTVLEKKKIVQVFDGINGDTGVHNNGICALGSKTGDIDDDDDDDCDDDDDEDDDY